MALISLRMLLESPNPKDPQDAEVAKMMLERPDEFARKAHEWAVQYAGAPRRDYIPHNYKALAKPQVTNDLSRYGYIERNWVYRCFEQTSIPERIIHVCF
jgi:Ubiquitin-protein ligase